MAHVAGDDYDVTFRFHPDKSAGQVEAVYLAGSFNDWKEKGQAMEGPDAKGNYLATVRLKPGLHEYKFVINGNNWQPDPENPDTNGPFSNSVVRVQAAAEN